MIKREIKQERGVKDKRKVFFLKNPSLISNSHPSVKTNNSKGSRHQLEMYLIKKKNLMREMSNNLCNFIHGKPQCKKMGAKY